MKKNLSIIALPLLCLLLTSCSGTVQYSDEDYVKSIEFKEDFKILQLTDIHISAKDNVPMHLNFIDLTINQAKPDFIFLTGDTFSFANKLTVRQVFDHIESFNVPWTYTYGNHDDQGFFDRNYIARTLTEYPHCTFINNENDNITGRGNNVLNLVKDNKVVYQIYNFESGTYHFGDYMGYDAIQPDQIEWYRRQVENANKAAYGEAFKEGESRVPNVAFFHIPFPEYKDAYEAYKADPSIGSGENREGVSSSPENNGLFEAMKSLKSTKGVFVGHDHVNYSAINYQGILLAYGVKATDRVYYDKDLLGGRTITLHSDGKLETSIIIHRYEEVK